MRCWCSTSTPALAALSAEDFITERLLRNIGARGVVTGEDFTFGHDKRGTTAMLAALGAGHGMAVETVAPVMLGRGDRVLDSYPRRAEGRRSARPPRGC